MFFAEKVFLFRINIEHTDHFVLDDQRNREFGVDIGYHSDVARICGDVVDQNRLASLGGDTSDSLTYLHSGPVSDFLGVANLKADAEFLRSFIQEKDGEDFEINDFAN